MWSIRFIRFFVTFYVGFGHSLRAFSLSSLLEEGQFFANQSPKIPPLEEEVDSKNLFLKTEAFKIRGLCCCILELPPPSALL